METTTLFFLSPLDVYDFRHECKLMSLEIDFEKLTITDVFSQEDIILAVDKFEAKAKKNESKIYSYPFSY